MKELGVTDQQLGYLISLGYIAGIFMSLVSGTITDRLGRKRTTLVFDFISWPLSVIIYLVSDSFLFFALAVLANSFSRIVGVSWNLMVIEDADNDQRVAAFNLLNIINISTGILIPVGGIAVTAFGVVAAERFFLAFAAVSMFVMIIVRNHFYRETAVGRRILEERKANPVKFGVLNMLPFKSAKVFRGNVKAILAAAVYILFFLYIPLGSFNSLFFAPYLTEALGLGKSTISLLGGVYSGVMLIIFVFVIPLIGKRDNVGNMQVGIAVQAVSLLLLILIPPKSMLAAVLCIAAYSAGFGIFRPFVDSMLALVTEGDERASLYSMINTFICIFTAIIGFVSGSIYKFNPRLIYIISAAILAAILVLLGCFRLGGDGGQGDGSCVPSD